VSDANYPEYVHAGASALKRAHAAHRRTDHGKRLSKRLGVRKGIGPSPYANVRPGMVDTPAQAQAGGGTS